MAQNPFFLIIIVVTVVGQYFIVEKGGEYTMTTPLSSELWVMSVFFGALSIPLGFFMRLIPVNEAESSFAECDGGVRGEAKGANDDVKNNTMMRENIINLLVACGAIGAAYWKVRN